MHSAHCNLVCTFKQVWQSKCNLFQANSNLLAETSNPLKTCITRFLFSKHNFSINLGKVFLSLPKIGFVLYWYAIYIRCIARSPTNVLSNTAVTHLGIYISLRISRLKSLLCLHLVSNKHKLNISYFIEDSKKYIVLAHVNVFLCVCVCVHAGTDVFLCLCVCMCVCVFKICLRLV